MGQGMQGRQAEYGKRNAASGKWKTKKGAGRGVRKNGSPVIYGSITELNGTSCIKKKNRENYYVDKKDDVFSNGSIVVFYL